MPLFTYSARINGGSPTIGEVDAATAATARAKARRLYAKDGAEVQISMVFPAPPRLAPRPGTAAPPPRVNYRRSMYEKTLRREARAK